jgi:hypothetical protein
MAAAEADQEARRADYVDRRERYLRSVKQGVNILGLNAHQMCKMKQGIYTIFRYEITRIGRNCNQGEQKNGAVLKEVHRNAMHKTRIHFVQGLNRDPR